MPRERRGAGEHVRRRPGLPVALRGTAGRGVAATCPHARALLARAPEGLLQGGRCQRPCVPGRTVTRLADPSHCELVFSRSVPPVLLSWAGREAPRAVGGQCQAGGR